MKKGIKYIVGIVLAIIVVYHSVYFRPLDEKLSEDSKVVFDANAYVNKIWEDGLLLAFDSAIDINTLFHQLNTDPNAAFDQHANALAIGNIGYFRVKGEGIVMQVNPNNVLLDIDNQTIEIQCSIESNHRQVLCTFRTLHPGIGLFKQERRRKRG